MRYKTEQEEFWSGDFGNNYINRNNSEALLHFKVALWAKMLRSTNKIKSIRELGCNIGLNLLALKKLNSELNLTGYEINQNAARAAMQLNIGNITNGSILDKINDKNVDLTFTMGVLIHIDPNYLSSVYSNLVNGSNRYILIAEYYNPTPIQVEYRGNKNKLFKRDFAGDLIDNYGLKLVDYGFVYKGDNWAPHDDLTWFLLEK